MRSATTCTRRERASGAPVRGIDIQNCGCFALDASGRAAGWELIAGDLALLAAALVVAVVPPRAAEAAADASPARGRAKVSGCDPGRGRRSGMAACDDAA